MIDQLTSNEDGNEIEEVPNDDIVFATTERAEMPFLQNEDGEIFMSNVITFGATDPLSTVDDAQADIELHDDLNESISLNMVEELLLTSETQVNETQLSAIELPEQRR